jgi:hypothetical protein
MSGKSRSFHYFPIKYKGATEVGSKPSGTPTNYVLSRELKCGEPLPIHIRVLYKLVVALPRPRVKLTSESRILGDLNV